jgi:uncharacterized coiled-coil DUF342 family protein
MTQLAEEYSEGMLKLERERDDLRLIQEDLHKECTRLNEERDEWKANYQEAFAFSQKQEKEIEELQAEVERLKLTIRTLQGEYVERHG